ncbi:hypothetical protein [Halotalea alkalilenta]|nr:hypothetical protein [Halotalea alkalilenta]
MSRKAKLLTTLIGFGIKYLSKPQNRQKIKSTISQLRNRSTQRPR